MAQTVKVSAYNVGDQGLIPGPGRSSGEGSGNPLQYSCLENPMDGGAWWSTIHGVAKSRRQLSNSTFTFHLFPLEIRKISSLPPKGIRKRKQSKVSRSKGMIKIRERRNKTDLKENKQQGFPGGSVVKNPPANAGDTDSAPGLLRLHSESPETANTASSRCNYCSPSALEPMLHNEQPPQ